jgi:hypothetical protein
MIDSGKCMKKNGTADKLHQFALVCYALIFRIIAYRKKALPFRFFFFHPVYASQFSCRHDMARPQIADEGDGFQENRLRKILAG